MINTCSTPPFTHTHTHTHLPGTTGSNTCSTQRTLRVRTVQRFENQHSGRTSILRSRSNASTHTHHLFLFLSLYLSIDLKEGKVIITTVLCVCVCLCVGMCMSIIIPSYQLRDGFQAPTKPPGMHLPADSKKRN